MSFKLTKDEKAQRDALSAKLTEAAQEISAKVEAFNEEVEKLKAGIETAVESYNIILAEARDFVVDVYTQADQDISDKSEKWQEGDKGQAALSWKNHWEQLDMEEFNFEFPDELIISEPSHADDLDQAPEGCDD